MREQPDDKRRRFAYHQAGHGTVLAFWNREEGDDGISMYGLPSFKMNVMVDEIRLPRELPEKSTSLPLKENFRAFEYGPSLSDYIFL